MVLTAAEKMRRHREKIKKDPDKYAIYQMKEKKRWVQRKKDKKVKSIKDLSLREQRLTRRKWRKAQASSRQKKKNAQSNLTPPTSPSEVPLTRQYISGRKQKLKQLSKVFRENERLKFQLKTANKQLDRYRKRWERATETRNVDDTPRSKTKKLLRNFSSGLIRKKLFAYEVLIQEIKSRYKETKEKRCKREYKRLIAGKIMKKYKLLCFLKSEIEISHTKFHDAQNVPNNTIVTRYADKVKEFFERDDNSITTAGKKNTITRRKVKKQRRLLTDSRQNLHLKFISENVSCHLSYTSFCRMKPFWVVTPTMRDRETCICKIHDNLQFLASKLKQLNYIQNSNLEYLVTLVTCNINDKVCMYGECSKCNHGKIEITVEEDKAVEWFQWTREKRKYSAEDDRDVTFTQKSVQIGSIKELINSFKDQLLKFKVHFFNIRHQYKCYTNFKLNMKEDHAMIHIDFAENYVAKSHRAIQAVHFGASQKQITLHNGVFFVGPDSQSHTFSTISNSLEHGPPGIWAYMNPVLDSILSKYPKVKVIHFFSDGPATQYRQKLNFFLFTQMIADRGLTYGSWNYLEAGHGKGIPDGVGATLKRSADQLVCNGIDITTASIFYNEVKKSVLKVEMFYVEESEVIKMKENISDVSLQTIQGTMRIHQILTQELGKLDHRVISCADHINSVCNCYDAKTFVWSEMVQNSDRTGKQDTADQKSTKSVKKVTTKGESYFSKLLTSFHKCKAFQELENKCLEANKLNIGELQYHQNLCQTTCKPRLNVDTSAENLMPSDFIRRSAFVPVAVEGDGNCLARVGSVFAYKNQLHHCEIRARIVMELVLHKSLYLNPSHLRKGTSCNDKQSSKLPFSYAMYSDLYTPGTKLTLEIIETIYQQEVMNVTKPKVYLGIWQIFALSSVLGRPLLSVYPERGNPNVRSDLNRTIIPREEKYSEPAAIMWTSTRDDMVERNWIPNHFVPLLLTSVDQNQNVIEQVVTDQNVVEQVVMDQNLVEQVVMDQNLVEQVVMDQNLVEQVVTDQNLVEQVVMDQDQNLVEQVVMDQNVVEQVVEQVVTDQNLGASQNLVEQVVMDQDQNLVEQVVMDQNVVVMDQNVVEQVVTDQNVVEQVVTDQNVVEQVVMNQNVVSKMDQNVVEQVVMDQESSRIRIVEQVVMDQNVVENRSRASRHGSECSRASRHGSGVEQNVVEQVVTDQNRSRASRHGSECSQNRSRASRHGSGVEQNVVEQVVTNLVEQVVMNQNAVEQVVMDQNLVEQVVMDQNVVEQECSRASRHGPECSRASRHGPESESSVEQVVMDQEQVRM